MFDIGWTELLVIGVVALIVVGPKDLPQMFRTLGRFTAKAKSMAREFTRAMEDAADEAGVKDMAKDLKSATSARSLGLDQVEKAVSKFEKWDPMAPDDDDASAKKGPATEALSKERAEAARKISDAGAKAALKRQAAEAAAEAKPAVPAKKTTAKKPPTSKAAPGPAAKKATAKKPAAKKPAAKKTAAKKPASKVAK
jgi:sec-independent protein translocase protein TatB